MSHKKLSKKIIPKASGPTAIIIYSESHVVIKRLKMNI